MELRIKIDHIEEILINMGFLQSEDASNFEDKLEFMKLWELLTQLQRDEDGNRLARNHDKGEGPWGYGGEDNLRIPRKAEEKPDNKDIENSGLDMYIKPSNNVEIDQENGLKDNPSENQDEDVLAECLRFKYDPDDSKAKQ